MTPAKTPIAVAVDICITQTYASSSTSSTCATRQTPTGDSTMTAPHDDQPSRDMDTLNAALRDLRAAERIASLESIIAGLTVRAEQAEYRLQQANAACARLEADRGRALAALHEIDRRLGHDDDDEALRQVISDVMDGKPDHVMQQLEMAREALRVAEWASTDIIGDEACPVCGRTQDEGHYDDCKLRSVLAGPSA